MPLHPTPTLPFISPLPRSTSTQIRSSLIIPTLPQILSELIQNSLDASAKSLVVRICLEDGDQSLRVEDDGCGIPLQQLTQVGRRFVTSKSTTGHHAGHYGFRGEALASIAALGLLEVYTRPENDSRTYAKIIKGSKILFHGLSNRPLGKAGTTVIVKDIFHGIPVRQAALAASSRSSTLSACRKVIETLALAHSSVSWTVWEDRDVETSSSSSKKIMTMSSHDASLATFKELYGGALVEQRVQKIRVSSGFMRVDGFISLEGASGRVHQHLYVNHYPVQRSELHLAISQKFSHSRFSAMNQDEPFELTHSDSRRSPRKLDKHPVYVLDVCIPAEDVDVQYEPKKGLLGYKDLEKVKAFVLAVVDEFLKRHDFLVQHTKTNTLHDSSSTPLARLHERSASSATQILSPMQSLSDLHRPISTPTQAPRPFTPSHPRDRPTHAASEPVRKRARVVTSVRKLGVEKRPDWIDDILADVDTGVWNATPLKSSLNHTLTPLPPLPSSSKCCVEAGLSSGNHTSSVKWSCQNEITFPHHVLKSATVLGQVDDKFICCVLPTEEAAPISSRIVVLVDQHAADERVSVEFLLHDLCVGFMKNDIPITRPKDDLGFVISREEAQQLSRTVARDIFRRWGIDLCLPDSKLDWTTVDWVQCHIRAYPSILPRLGRKDGQEMARLVKLYLPVVLDGLGEISTMLGSINDHRDIDQGRILRWMPQEMLELVNSKACRSAIMFQDKLDQEQCVRLVAQLAETRNPFSCAHGRPSLVPIVMLSTPPAGTITGKREDWSEWSKQT
ncbi:hypothetical protein TREMEDRAFT_34488 [Tremella mesenterica DSM 1558]|uniref:uncharacterized protein n=1 Tax=Tremella mesenterica (strain ATCC 24925 / CBS 8224 / DSM 1558 / NBRC 9311 / NRRL Y-6157 / RJB 2259-6 / UBC 559-6) TaxID=578456 RepID=UPI00032D6424|nr:uncharacterized protein TREMEDRAFT_34488 [Tremella mesenterica DSM 1558]EIW66724.1 hypothetical protein TREMEDRAFT_34488 [Tremella mesenterica DSM 1558]